MNNYFFFFFAIFSIIAAACGDDDGQGSMCGECAIGEVCIEVDVDNFRCSPSTNYGGGGTPSVDSSPTVSGGSSTSSGATSQGALTCNETVDCIGQCSDEECASRCISNSTPQAVQLFNEGYSCQSQCAEATSCPQCDDEWVFCYADTHRVACGDFVDCLTECTTQECADACAAVTPAESIALFNDWYSCFQNTCGGDTSCTACDELGARCIND